METALFSAASLFHGADDSDDERDEMQVDSEGEKPALEYVERAHDFPGVKLSVREFSSHELNANLLWPGTFSFATWLVKNLSILDGQRVLELGSGTGALAIFLRKSFGVDIMTSDYDDKEIEENIAYNCRANSLDVLPHIRHTWGDPFPVSRPDWDIVIASDILLYVKQYDNLVKTVSFLLKGYNKTSEKAGCTTITDKSGTQVPAKSPMFLMSWRRRIGKDQSLFFTGCEHAGLEVHHLGDLVYLISIKS
ncbi:hypothetical protein BAE44_0023702 [Dichanthelium oligosanthes]|uniref:Protein N-lysine methyltransferase METTL21A n=1 Tax=Dichanthelium oligosanthes TaxID=888268 RepID=A0A1E5UR36_9POAL|nr:hypothetical protein BAE44_0023702 [Dichanthelium oligosanthes]